MPDGSVANVEPYRAKYGRFVVRSAGIDPDLASGQVEFGGDAPPVVFRLLGGAKAEAFYRKVEGAIRDWFAGPEAMAMALRNDVRFALSGLAIAEERVAWREFEAHVAKVDRADARQAMRKAMREAEAELAGLPDPTPSGPSP